MDASTDHRGAPRLRHAVQRIVRHEGLNFFLTNRIPRRWATRFMGWFSRIEHPIVSRPSLAAWRLFCEVDLHDARTTRFASVHDCFVRELKEGARPIDPTPDVLVSPCDGQVGAFGRVRGTECVQAKGLTYSLDELLADPDLVARHRDGVYVTLRLTAGMYHRFHAPDDCVVDQVVHVPGDAWNVNPAALGRVPRLYCRNERAIVRARLAASGRPLTLVAVGAILVGSIRLSFLEEPLDRRHRGPARLRCRAALRRGDEMGYFHLGSTIIVFADGGVEPCRAVRDGSRIRMGEPLLRCR